MMKSQQGYYPKRSQAAHTACAALKGLSLQKQTRDKAFFIPLGARG